MQAALAPLFYHTYIVRLGLGLEGAALAVVSLQCISTLLLAGFTAARNWGERGGERATWHGWSSEALRGWGEYLSLAIPSVIMICMKVRGLPSGWARPGVRVQLQAAPGACASPTHIPPSPPCASGGHSKL